MLPQTSYRLRLRYPHGYLTSPCFHTPMGLVLYRLLCYYLPETTKMLAVARGRNPSRPSSNGRTFTTGASHERTTPVRLRQRHPQACSARPPLSPLLALTDRCYASPFYSYRICRGHLRHPVSGVGVGSKLHGRGRAVGRGSAPLGVMLHGTLPW